MSDKGVKISDLPELSQLTGDEQVPIVREGGNFRFTLRNIKTLISKEDLGLDKVANLAPADYPISTDTQAALDEKAAVEHDHAIGDVTGLQDALDGKAPTQHTHTVAQVEGLEEDLAGKANQVHNHEITDVNGLADALGSKANTNHTHSINNVNGLSNALQNLQTQLDQKAPALHEHTASDITDFGPAVVAAVNQNFPGAGDVTTGELQW